MVEIPDELFRKAEVQAAAQGRTVTELVSEALEAMIGDGKSSGADANSIAQEPAWMEVFGSLKDHKEELRQINLRIKEEPAVQPGGEKADRQWMKLMGCMKGDPEDRRRIEAAIEEEFEQIDPEMWK